MVTTIEVNCWDWLESKAATKHYENILATAVKRHFSVTRARAYWGIVELWDSAGIKQKFTYTIEGRTDDSKFWRDGIPHKNSIGVSGIQSHIPYKLLLTPVKLEENET